MLWPDSVDLKKDTKLWRLSLIGTELALKRCPQKSQKPRSSCTKFMSSLHLTTYCASFLNQVLFVGGLTDIAISIPNVLGKAMRVDITKKGGKERRARSPKMSFSLDRFRTLLRQALETIESLFEHACRLCPSSLAQVVGLLLAEARLLSSIITEPERDQNHLALRTVILLGISTIALLT